MNRRKRCSEPKENGKQIKKHKHFRHAQRKFASLCPSSPIRKEKPISIENPKAEDFLEFLCVRNHTTTLKPELEIFAEPQQERHELLHSDSEDELPLQYVRNLKSVQSRDSTPASSTSRNVSPVPFNNKFKPIINDCDDSDSEKGDIDEEDKQSCITDIEPSPIKLSEMKDFFECINKFDNALTLLSPPLHSKSTGYMFNDLQFTIKTLYVHRLKTSLCSNFITLLAIKEQLEKEHANNMELPKIGYCELDLSFLMDTVNSFGGLERINSDDSWKTVADNLYIPKTVPRRVKRVEDIYLKYILPYETLPKKDKINLRNNVSNRFKEHNSWPVQQIACSPTDVNVFQKMANNYSNMYCKSDLRSIDVAQQFWDIIQKGDKHICAISGEIELADESWVYENSRLPWKHHELFALEDSALKYLDGTCKYSSPTLLFEGVFSTPQWCSEEHGFTLLFYLHSGMEKVWYVVPEECSKQFLRLKREFKDFVLPSELVSKGCPVYRCVQKEGEYVFIQPNSYYCSVATGYVISEWLTVAPMNWFFSSNFLSFKPKLNEYVITRLILNCSVEESKKETKSYCCQFLTQKLDFIAKFISDNVKKLNACGIKNSTCLKLKEPPLLCPKCNCVCYLIRVRVKSKNSSFCIEDAEKMIQSKLKTEDFIIELMFTVEKINALIKKLIAPANKKRR